jgi:hypothetical protein
LARQSDSNAVGDAEAVSVSNRTSLRTISTFGPHWLQTGGPFPAPPSYILFFRPCAPKKIERERSAGLRVRPRLKRRASSSECSQVGLPERIDSRPIRMRFAIAERQGLSIGDRTYIDRPGAKARCLIADIKQRRCSAIVLRQFEQSCAPHRPDTDPTVRWRRLCYRSGSYSRGGRRWQRWGRRGWRRLYTGKQQSRQQHYRNFPVHPHPPS